MSTAPRVLPTTVTGSHALPSWLVTALEHVRRGEYGRFDVTETMEDAVMIAVQDQERAGVDIIWDGEMRRLDFIMGFYERFIGLEQVPPPRKIGVPLYDQEVLYRPIERVTAPNGLGIIDELRYLKTITDRPLKVPVPGPLTLMTATTRGPAYADHDELAWDFSRIIRDECLRLVSEGATFIQLDEPAFHHWFQDSPARVAELFNATVEGVNCKIAMHICFGNRVGRPRAKRTYRPIFPFLKEFKADQFVLEFANREMAEIELWREYGGDKELGAGILDQKSFYRETAEDIAERLRLVLKYAAPDKVYVNPDCGLNYTPRWVAKHKLKAMVDGTRLVRRELGAE